MSGFDLKDKLKTLIAQREILEIEANAIGSELNSPGLNGEPAPGVRGSLVDSEGYPRGDIDLYNVMNKRKRLNEINADYKSLMKDIEDTLKRIYATAPSAAVDDAPKTTKTEDVTVVESLDRGIAKLDEILPGSPAADAGIVDGDILMQFGHVKRSTPDALKSIAKLVGDSLNVPIPLTIRRGDSIVDVQITPASWGGRGLLGCHLSPLP